MTSPVTGRPSWPTWQQHGGTAMTDVVEFNAEVRRRTREPNLTDAELIEYRRLRPALLQMLEEWQKIRTGCPVARNMLSGRE